MGSNKRKEEKEAILVPFELWPETSIESVFTFVEIWSRVNTGRLEMCLKWKLRTAKRTLYLADTKSFNLAEVWLENVRHIFLLFSTLDKCINNQPVSATLKPAMQAISQSHLKECRSLSRMKASDNVRFHSPRCRSNSSSPGKIARFSSLNNFMFAK